MRTIVLAAALAVAGCNQLFGLDPIGGADDPRCGDGTIDPGAGEQCDDGDRVPGDGCDDACQFEDGVIGCSDGERDGFVDVVAWPGIAACAGRWVVPGTMAGRVGINCARAGDDTGIADGCAMADLCAAGWRPCQAADLDVGDCPETLGFWVADGGCTGTTAVVGCSVDVGEGLGGCPPFARTLGPGCTGNSTAGWTCTPGTERATVVHNDERGGVLCCKL